MAKRTERLEDSESYKRALKFLKNTDETDEFNHRNALEFVRMENMLRDESSWQDMHRK